jgi:hypothetical protein
LRCAYFAGNPGWDRVEPVYLKETVTGGAPAQATGLKVAWSETSLHVRFEAEDTEAWGTLTHRDDPLFNEEVVEVFLDPVGDLQSYFEIEVSPLNVVCDLVLRKTRSGYQKEFAWDCEHLQTTTEVATSRWITEMAIPFASLCPEPPVLGERWRVNFFRIDRPRKALAELSAWSPTGMRRFHVQQRFGILEFVGSAPAAS